MDERLAALADDLRSMESVLVAFSGGADSAFVLAAAVRALGPDRVAAATAVSPSLPAAELGHCRALAASMGVRHLTPATDEGSRAGYRANTGDRCYFCKAELVDVLMPLARDLGVRHVVTGTNADDAVAGFRPGIRAADERGARAPLRDAGLTKDDVRAASRAWGLPTWDRPAAACLASRVAYGIEVTPARLARVERAEATVRALLAAAGVPVRDLRVRDLGGAARVELDGAALGALETLDALGARAAGSPTDEVRAAVRAAGMAAAGPVEVRAFRSGSLNDALRAPRTGVVGGAAAASS